MIAAPSVYRAARYARRIGASPTRTQLVTRDEDALRVYGLGAGAIVHVIGRLPAPLMAALRYRELRGVRLVWISDRESG